MKRFLAKQGIDCRCGHGAHNHQDERARCEARNTRYLFKKTEPSTPCACTSYRPSVLALLFELWP